MRAARKLVSGDSRDVYGDFFCGGGGLTKGFARALEKLGIKNVRLIAINHSKMAVETHKANHPWAEHYCSRVDQLDPRRLVQGGRMRVAMFAPECTNHANARGGRPINDQSRATAWDVLKWAQEIYIETILVENVREIMDWGPLGADGLPLKSKKGQIFRQWIEAIKACGYHLEYRILNAADYGAATTRKRFFLIARRANRKIVWPEQTHAKDADSHKDLFCKLRPWRGAWEVINWENMGIDIMERRRYGLPPLAKNTMTRIEAGIRKFWSADVAEPFIVKLRGTKKRHIEGSAKSVREPLSTVTGGGIHHGLVQPFIVGLEQTKANGKQVRAVDEPVLSLTRRGGIGLVQPFIIGCGGPQRSGDPKSVEKPLGTVLTRNHRALVRPVIVPFFGERDGQSPRTHDVERPMPAVTSHGAGGLVQPFVVQVNHGTDKKSNNSGRVRSVHEPVTTITSEKGHALVQPLLVKYYRTGRAQPVTQPVPTLTGNDRFGLLTPTIEEVPEGYELRAYFRMFEDEECARAMGFEGYEFRGTKKQRMLMIGNAVEVNQAEALCTAILSS